VKLIFTGLIEELGAVNRLERGSAWGKITLAAHRVLEGLKIGDSVAINGVCLTATRIGGGEFSADVMAETLKRTNLGDFKPGDPVNLERALTLENRLGGHLVQGHVDGTGRLVRDETLGIARLLTIRAPEELLAFIVAKGSIAIDGISLTVVEVAGDSFQVSLIPHTAAQTTLGHKTAGAVVNLETDILGRYVYKFVTAGVAPASSRLSAEFLAANGF
jgi:riboflavin synthase